MFSKCLPTVKMFWLKKTKMVSKVLIIRIERLIKRQGKEIGGDMRKVYSICRKENVRRTDG